MAKIEVIKKAFRFLNESKAKVTILYGGAGAGKSYAIAQFLLLKRAIKYPNKRILICRKYNNTLRLSVYRLIKEILTQLNIPFTERISEQTISLLNGTELIFRGLDDPQRIKSSEFNYIWMEEATEFSYEDYVQLRLRLRRHTAGQRNQMYLSFNPISKKHWLYKEFFQRIQDDVNILKLTYKDNPFLTADFRKVIENLQNQDERLYKIYALGEFADLTNLVYTNYEITPIEGDLSDKIVYGLDFGFNNPSALVKVAITDDSIYILDEFYRSYLTNAELIQELKRFGVGNGLIVCDSAEPARIRELQEAGFNAVPCVKTNVLHEIDLIKRYKIKIAPHCVNFIKEIETYAWKTDRNGNILEEPVKFMDHTMDALRYAVYTHMHHAGTKIFDKQEWGVF